MLTKFEILGIKVVLLLRSPYCINKKIPDVYFLQEQDIRDVIYGSDY